MYSLIVPVYRNEESIPRLVEVLEALNVSLGGELEAVLVVDGSPDRSFDVLRDVLPTVGFRSRLILLSRNFGAFNAIRTGLREADGPYFAVMAADLQEPPELVQEFFERLRDDEADVILGTRENRSDPAVPRLGARVFWGFYRRFVQRDVPRGGFDVFGCNRMFRDHLVRLREANSSLVGQILWLGFRRLEIPYSRQPRREGSSGWTLRRRVRYLADSVFSFTDLPIRVLTALGALGLLAAVGLGLAVLVARLSGFVSVPGYSATALMVIFFGGLNCLGIGIIGSYVWRAYENTKGRPLSEIMAHLEYGDGKS